MDGIHEVFTDTKRVMSNIYFAIKACLTSLRVPFVRACVRLFSLTYTLSVLQPRIVKDSVIPSRDPFCCGNAQDRRLILFLASGHHAARVSWNILTGSEAESSLLLTFTDWSVAMPLPILRHVTQVGAIARLHQCTTMTEGSSRK